MMSLQSVYKLFLSEPSSALLAEDASLHYVTTLASINGSSAVIKHLKSNQVNLKALEILDAVEGPASLALEVETTLQFVNGGGSYLPALDSNFIEGLNVTLPVVHFITFDSEKRINQIRLSWDQGSLLKLVNVIGKTGRNWPISDGKGQINLIVSSLRSVGNMTNKMATTDHDNTYDERLKNGSITAGTNSSVGPQRQNSSNRNDPESNHGLITNTTITGRSISDSTENYISSKLGSAKKFGPVRLFDREDNETITPKKSTNPLKFKHFDFTDTPQEDVEIQPALRVKPGQHGAHWDFSDFVTPQKVIPSKVIRTNELRHWGTSDDEVIDSPEKTNKPIRPRKDFETHFRLQDEGSPEKEPRIIARPTGQAHNDGLSLYKNLFDEENGYPAQGEEARVPNLANIKHRQKDFESHFTMTDKSPGIKNDVNPTEKPKSTKVTDSSWHKSDYLPSQKENILPIIHSPNSGTGQPLSEATNTMNNRNDVNRGIRTDGDGTGAKKGTTRSWGFGDESDGEEAGGVNRPGLYKTGKQTRRAQPTGGDFWDF